MGLDQPSHWLIIAVIVIVLFGWKKLPDASRSLGRSLRIFKAETKGLINDGKDDKAEKPAAAPAQIVETPVAQAAPVAAPAPVAQPVHTIPAPSAPLTSSSAPLSSLPLNQNQG